MANIDKSLVGDVISALPLDKMIGGPLQAMIAAQIQASKGFADFLMSVCIEKGKAKTVEFTYDETIIKEDGTDGGVRTKKMTIPLMAAITLPNMAITEGEVAFELTISQSVETKTETKSSGSFAAKMGWGPFSVSMKGSVSHKSEQTRKTDTRAKYSIKTKVAQQPVSEGLSRVIDFMVDQAVKPTPNTKISKDALPNPE